MRIGALDLDSRDRRSAENAMLAVDRRPLGRQAPIRTDCMIDSSPADPLRVPSGRCSVSWAGAFCAFNSTNG